MKAATFRDELLESLRELAWSQWSQLGVSGSAPLRRDERAADPESLLLFTLVIGRTDPRLFDEVLDWLALNEPIVSVHRLRNLCVTQADRALVEAALAWTARVRGRGRAAITDAPPATEPLFSQFRISNGDLDPAFERFGFARPPLKRSGKSLPANLQDPIAFALRLRRMLGVGARAEVVRALLTIRAPRLSSKVITASAGFAQRNVREALTALLEAGVVTRIGVADERFYKIDQNAWATVLGMSGAPELPFHEDWIPAFRALAAIARWVQDPDLEDLSPYMRASRARTLMGEVEHHLRFIGLPPAMYTARGADYWDQFTDAVHFAVRHISR